MGVEVVFLVGWGYECDCDEWNVEVWYCIVLVKVKDVGDFDFIIKSVECCSWLVEKDWNYCKVY